MRADSVAIVRLIAWSCVHLGPAAVPMCHMVRPRMSRLGRLRTSPSLALGDVVDNLMAG